MIKNKKEFEKFLLSSEEKKLYYKLKIKSMLDRTYIISLRSYLDHKGIEEYLYSDDVILLCLIKGCNLCSK